MAVRRPAAAIAAVAVVLLVCLSSGALAAKEASATEPSLSQADGTKQTVSSLKPQHAPQFPEDPVMRRKRQNQEKPVDSSDSNSPSMDRFPTPEELARLVRGEKPLPSSDEQQEEQQQEREREPVRARRPEREEKEEEAEREQQPPRKREQEPEKPVAAPTPAGALKPEQGRPIAAEPAPSAPAPKQPVQEEQKPAAVAPTTPATKAPEQKPAPAKQEEPAAASKPAPAKPETPAAKPVAPVGEDIVKMPEVAKVDMKEIEKKEKEEEKENPCKRVPGCLECKPFDKASQMEMMLRDAGKPASRRLLQFGSHSDAGDGGWGSNTFNGITGVGAGATKDKHKIDLNPMDFVDSPYNAKDLPMCTACNTTGGYVQHTKGRCACAPGFGDTQPTGSCFKCTGGYFSSGGFRAVCTECEGVAFSNTDRTACVCASGWYGITSFATKQASCNQCPGSRPVSAEGARGAADCRACPEGQVPNEIYSDCVDPSAIPKPEEIMNRTRVPDEAPADPTGPGPQPLFNKTTFADTKKDWTITTRNTGNHSNILSDFLGSIMDSVVYGKNVTSSAKSPGDLLYQVLTKPAPEAPKLPTLPNIDMNNPASLGAGVGAALSAMPGVLGKATHDGGKISDVVNNVVKAVETGSQAVGADGGAAAAGGSGWEAFVKGLSATAPKDSAGKSELADFAKSVGDLFGAASKVASEAVEKSDNSLVKSIGGLLTAAKSGTLQAPLSSESALVGSTDTPVPGAAAPAAGNSWANMLSGMLSGKPAADSAPAATTEPAASSADIGKMLASLTTPTKVANPNPATITVEGAQPAGDSTMQSSTKFKSTKSDAPASSGGGLGGLLGGLLGPKKPSTLSFANAAKSVSWAQLAGSKAQTTGDGFLSVPSAPPKGSSAIKSGKFNKQKQL